MADSFHLWSMHALKTGMQKSDFSCFTANGTITK
ncbi:protein of unknown function (plasmid) [Rhodovastum atsumiense]|nr:protein of unknown function [Rhodovastum atsumiense]